MMDTLSQIKQKLLFETATTAVLGTMISCMGSGLCLPPLHQAVLCCFGWVFWMLTIFTALLSVSGNENEKLYFKIYRCYKLRTFCRINFGVNLWEVGILHLCFLMKLFFLQHFAALQLMEFMRTACDSPKLPGAVISASTMWIMQ